jgi:hypothetical protein
VGAERKLETFDEKHYLNSYFSNMEKRRLFSYKLNGVHDNNVIKPIETRLWLSDNHCFAERDFINM